MSFQAYLDAVHAKTGQTPEQLHDRAVKLKIHSPDMKAGALIDWLAADYALGRGHAMSVWAVWKAKGWVSAPK